MAVQYIAEERAREISTAIATWKRIVADGAVTNAWRDGKVYWRRDFGYWAYFGRTSADTPLGWRYWNTFGTTPVDFQKNMLVEINPPQSGPAGGTQGLIAKAPDGARWILHGGRLHPSGLRVTSDMFAAESSIEQVQVRFSDGRLLPYFPVANLDGDSEDLHEQAANFIGTCQLVRTCYGSGAREGEGERRVQEAEHTSRPENGGRYVIPARAEVVADRIHADVWRALVKMLTERGVEHSNNRVGRYGPDLRTIGRRPALFEIKTDTHAHSLYEGLGQLLLYEGLLGRDYRKFLVLPGPAKPALSAIITKIGVNFIEFARKSRGVSFNETIIDRHFGANRSD